MQGTKLDKRFFESTRGRIVSLIRGTTKTVNDLAAELDLTDNAVRAHLLSLERDGLVRQSGIQRGTRKPHFAYELTPEAETLFPRAYDKVLNQLITVLKRRMAPKALKSVLRQVGHSLAGNKTSHASKSSLASRAEKGIAALEAIGGAARLEKEEGTLFIKSGSCPLAEAVTEHPEVCKVAESLLSEVTGATVQERCDRAGSPRCNFEITERQ